MNADADERPLHSKWSTARPRRPPGQCECSHRPLSGASYREIAGAIYGADRVRAEAWKTSALRDAVMGFVRDARAMIGGGYRRLLRRRRRK
ncbi:MULTISPECIES: DUF2285 domain-containing protein [Paracoccus]|uniref:DUF2285 domain-containing protein n=1 Tax=Paracoccus TaxID=265 RepID=UPI001E3B4C80|nr:MULTISPECIES: DUF2285 domain-containing protein [Paracoccus]MCU7429310.1 DUF2285 domain-containing protein [Paracoccus denitrificans]MDK8873298.1 DUF2285 domain-containing protein [Paracoccus sp. SSJ]UFS68295.1 DUF2285 domain-containing protein [Paracoccus denitrificans]UPV97506.1 DUF2285 domain-containing protein [Paracoccus denitrificans]WQO35418.1 DUF2285 domain-containing protein [Paracoccus denitrificans]